MLGVSELVRIAAIGCLLVLLVVPGLVLSRDDGACSISELRTDANWKPVIVACADDNTLDLRDRVAPDLSAFCDLSTTENCLPFMRQLLAVRMDFSEVLRSPRGNVYNGPFGTSTFASSGNFAFKEIGGDQNRAGDGQCSDCLDLNNAENLRPANGYGHYELHRALNLEGEVIGELWTLSILKARFTGARYFLPDPLAAIAVLEEARDIATGALSRRVWVDRASWFGREFDERSAVLYGAGDKSSYRVQMRQVSADGKTITRSFDDKGVSLNPGTSVPNPVDVFDGATTNFVLVSMKDQLEETSPSPTAVMGGYAAYLEGVKAVDQDKEISKAIAALDAKDSVSATAVLLGLIAANDPRPEPQLLMGLMYLEEGEELAADVALTRAIRKGKSCWRCFLARAVLLQRLGNEEGAMAHLDRAEELVPKSAVVAYYRARGLLMVGDENGARDILRGY